MNDFNPSSASKMEGPDLLPAPSENDLLRLPSMAKAKTSSLRPDADLTQGTPGDVEPPIAESEALALSVSAFDASENYFNASQRDRIADALARFNSTHPGGSKYHRSSYSKRSKLFRPKTRATIRKREAAAAISLFGASDIVNVAAIDGTEPEAMLDAKVQQELLNWRLQEDDRWYRFVINSVQDGDNQGFMVATTEWDYEETNRYFDEMHGELGKVKSVETSVEHDRPKWRLIPAENFFWSPGADANDIVGTSPYLIERMPMFVCDIRRHIDNPRARLKYRDVTDAELMAGAMDQSSTLRNQRERFKQDRYSNMGQINDYTVVWIHRNTLKINGVRWVFDTIGTTSMLSNIIPLSDFDPRGYPPYVVGNMVLESHNPYPAGGNDLMSQLQSEVNDTSNLRIDAMKMAMSGRMFIKRNTGVDTHALARFVPGATVEMDDPDHDVKWDRPNEPGNQSVEEQQMMTNELDDLMGNFNSQSVANNRNLNETVGGMEMIAGSADQITEYDLHTLVKTFLQKVLRQIMDLERVYESDNQIASVVGKKVGVRISQFWNSLSRPSKVVVNVGFGATNPQQRVRKLSLAMGTLREFFPTSLYEADSSEIGKEIFAAAGYPDASRFLPFLDKDTDKDPRIKTLQQTIAMLRMQLQPGMVKAQSDEKREQMKGQVSLKVAQLKAQTDTAREHYKQDTLKDIRMSELKLAYIELQLEHEKNDIARASLMMEREKLSNDIQMQWQEFNLQRQATQKAAEPPPDQPLPPARAAEAQDLLVPGSELGIPSFEQVSQTAQASVDKDREAHA